MNKVNTTFTDSITGTGIYNRQGDLIGNIENDFLRMAAIDGLNGDLPSEYRDLIETCIDNDIDEYDIVDLLKMKDTFKALLQELPYIESHILNIVQYVSVNISNNRELNTMLRALTKVFEQINTADLKAVKKELLPRKRNQK